MTSAKSTRDTRDHSDKPHPSDKTQEAVLRVKLPKWMIVRLRTLAASRESSVSSLVRSYITKLLAEGAE